MRPKTSRTLIPILALATLLPLAAGSPTWAQTPEENDESARTADDEGSLPLITTRTLGFTTDRGTWISLDVSPDGETILFELLGDLYTLPVDGGTATRITGGQAYDMQPRYSPDGSRIVFVSDRDGSENLWIAAADGSDPEPLTEEERESFMSPEWTPDGDYVIAVKGSDLWLFHVEGGSGVQVTGHDDDGPPFGARRLGPAFGADPDSLWMNVRGSVEVGFDTELGRAAVIDLHHGPRSSPRMVGAYQLAQLDRRTGRVRVRTHELEGAFRPVPSPDGRWVVYATRYDDREALKLLDLETGAESWLLMDVQRDDSQGGGSRDRDVYPGSAFTPDSSALITSFDGRIWRVEVPSGEATEIPFTARVEQELGPLVKFDYPIDDDELTVSQIRGARPSPDGSRLVFTALDRLWIAELPHGVGGPDDGAGAPPVISDARRLTDSDRVEHAPVWSPDGTWIAYVTWDDAEGGHVYRARADGSGEPERLTPTAAFYDKIVYSPDGERIVGVRGSLMHRMRTLEDFGSHGQAAELEYVWLPSDGGEPTGITWVGTGATQQGRNVPHFGPEPDRIYVWAGDEGLLSMRYDGTDVRTVVKVSYPFPGPSPFSPTPDEVLISPDGERALVRVNRNVHMITVPPVGGEAPTVSVGPSSSVPTWRLTKVGGDFIGWTADGSAAFWSIGRSFFLHDLATARQVVREAEAARKAEEGEGEHADSDEDDAADAGPDAADDPGSAEEDGDAAEPDAGRQASADDREEDDSLPEYAPHRVDVELVVAKDKPEGTVVLTGARLITMRGDEVIEEGDVVVRDNRIAAIGPAGEVEHPDGAEIRDMSGMTIYPGLVDIHAHTWVAWGVHREQVSQFLAQLAWGVTTQRDPQTSAADVVSYSDLMEVGRLIGPRLYSTGPGVFSSDNIQSLDEARDVLRRYSEHFDTQTIKQYLAGDRKVRQWVIMAARELGLTPTTEGGANFTMNLTLMHDGYAGLEHSLPITPMFEDVERLGAFSGLAYTPTLIVAYGGPSGRQHWLTHADIHDNDKLRTFTPHDEIDKWQSTTWYRQDQYVHPLQAAEITDWVEAGGRAGLGSHGEVQGLGTHWELWMMASGGLDPHAALRMATLDSADAIGLAGDLGSLEVGKLADLQVLEANPLEDLRNTTSIAYVMKNGRLYEADTLAEVWPRRRQLPTQWWWQVEPPGMSPRER